MATRKSELVITCNAKAVKDVFEYLNRQLADVKQKLKDLNAKGEKSGWTEQMKKDFRDLTKQATAIDSAIIHNQQTMVKYGQVMKDLSGSKLKDLKSALREATTALGKMSEKSPGRQKLIDDINRIKNQISGTSGLTMSFRQAQTQLKNLDNVSMEKLKQGLAAIKSQLDNPNIGNKWRRSLEQMQQQYQAAMAVRTAPVGTMPVTRMNAQQLGAERTALMSAIAATSGVKGYESKASGFEQRLKAVNEQLKVLTDNEKKADQAAKQLQATQEAAGTVRAVYRGQAVELEKLQAAYKTLQARQQQFAGTNDAKARAAAQQMALLKNRIDKVTAAMQAEIKIDKQFLKTATNAQLQNALTQLQQKLQSLNSTQSATAQKLKADMKAVETQIKRNTGAIQQQGNTFGTAIKNIAAYVGVFGAFNMIKSKVMEVYKSNLKLSDSLADIRKVSGLTSQEIDKLYTNITRIDTRNTIETLNKLAYAGAKLGVQEHGGVEALTGFVRAAEQVQMALGEDLGEEALPALAKLTEVMGLMDKYGVEQSMQKAASAIFMLSTTSTATGKNIVEFSKRLMGLANVSRVTADELLAIGSAADAMGLMPEVAATAFNKLFTSIQKGHNMIEKSLGLAQGSINANFAKGQTIKSIVDIFEAMNKKGNMNALDGIFKDLGSDGARLVAVMTTMADRVDILKKHLETSTKSFKDGTAVINEYMIQNETANALMERAQNMWAKAFTNPEGVDMVKQLAQEWYDVSKALTQSEGSMAAFHSSIEGITNTVITLIKTLPFLIKMLTWFGIFGGIRMMANSFIALVASIRAATTATATLQAVMNSNWVLAGIAAVVGGISLYIDHMNAAAEAAERAQKRQAELDMQLAKSKDAIDTVAVPLESYKRALNESNYSLEKRNQLMRDLLKGEYQDYLDYLGIEIDGAIDLAKAYDMVVKVLKQKKAYEEREQYRDEVNQGNKIDRMRAGMQFGQTAKSLGAGAEVDAEWLRRRHNLPVEDVMASVIKSAGGSVKAMDFGRGAKGNAYYDKAGNLIEATVLDRLRKNIREYSTSRNTENRMNKEVDELYKNEVGDFDMEKFQEEALKGQLKRKGQLDNLKPDKAALAAAKKAAQDAKQAMRKEMEDMQKQSTGIISKIEEWYRLQEAAINEARADGQLTEDQAAQMVTALSILKNESLSTARRAVTTGETAEWDEMKKNTLPKAMSDMTDLSVNLLKEIQEVPVEVLHKNLAKFNGDPNKVFGLDSRAFFDQMNAKAAGNQREAARLRAKLFGEAEKMLKQYELVQQATDKMQKDLETMGFVTESYEEFARRMQLGIMERPDRNLGLRASRREEIVGNYMSQYGNATPVSNTGDTKQLQDWLNKFTEGGKAKWAVGLPAISDWLKDAEGHLPEIRRFYETLAEIQRTAMQREKQGGNPLATTTEQNAQFDDLLGRRMSDKEAFSQMGMKFVGQGTIPYRINIENAQEAVEWLRDFATSGKGEMEDWAKAFPDTVGKWMKTLEEQGALDPSKTIGEQEVKSLEDALPQIKAMFYELESYASNIGSTIEKQVQAMTARNPIGIDEMRRQYEQRRQLTEQLYNDEMAKAGENAGALAELEAQKNQALIALDEQWRQQVYQIREQMGWVTQSEQYDNEVAMYKNMLDRKLISEKEFQQKKAQLQMKQGLNYAQMYNQQMSQLVDALRDYEITSTENKYDAMIRAAQANGEDTTALEEEKEAKILEIKKKYAAAEMMMKIAEIGINTAAGIMQAWVNPGYPGAIPLTVMIAALGAAQTAMAIAEYQKAMGASVSGGAANRKMKLASGMLTYDEGNVQTVVGDDGRVYRAKEQRSLPEGVSMVTEPIATTVNGQSALVGERGPEIVIGRKTTRAIQMNRPDLLRDLVMFDRGMTTRKARAFDEGNIQDLAAAIRPDEDGKPALNAAPQDGQLTSEDARALTAAIGVFAQTVAAMQKNGIPAKIQKYGTGGLIDEVQSGLKFVSKYK